MPPQPVPHTCSGAGRDGAPGRLRRTARPIAVQPVAAVPATQGGPHRLHRAGRQHPQRRPDRRRRHAAYRRCRRRPRHPHRRCLQSAHLGPGWANPCLCPYRDHRPADLQQFHLGGGGRRRTAARSLPFRSSAPDLPVLVAGQRQTRLAVAAARLNRAGAGGDRGQRRPLPPARPGTALLLELAARQLGAGHPHRRRHPLQRRGAPVPGAPRPGKRQVRLQYLHRAAFRHRRFRPTGATSPTLPPPATAPSWFCASCKAPTNNCSPTFPESPTSRSPRAARASR